MTTQDRAHFLPAVLASAASVADEIIVVDGGSRDGSIELLQRHPLVKLVQLPFPGHWGEQKNRAIERADGDWILVLDSDELLGDRLRRELPTLLRSNRYTHYKFARYWLTDTQPLRYVDHERLYPDLQLRLFRNLPQFRYEPGRVVHSRFPRKGRGPGKKCPHLHLFHFDFLQNDRRAREAKVEIHNRVDPAAAETSRMYLFEDLPHRVRACRETLCEEHLSAASSTRESGPSVTET